MGLVRRATSIAVAAAIVLSLASTPLGHADAPTAPSNGPTIDGAAIRTAVDKLSSDVRGWSGSVGVSVVEIDTGRAIAAENDAAPLNPASNAKLVTAAAALRRLGPAHRYLTGLYGKVSGESVAELVLRGQGDPSLATHDLWNMARELRGLGVRRVRSIAVDQSYFDERYVPPAFEAQPNEWAPFRAPVAAVSLNENTVLFTVVPTESKKDALVRVDPPGFVDVSGAVRTTAKRDPEACAVALEPKGGRLAARVSGHVPDGDQVVRIARRVDDPRLLAGYALKSALEDAGVTVEGGASAPIKLGDDAEKHLLVAHRSAELGALLTALGKESDNFYAEMIFKTLGAEQGTRPGTHDAAAQVAAGAVRELGVPDEGMIIKNGSGLYDANRIPTRAVTALLRAAYRDPALMPEYVGQLAIGGVDGTLKGRFHAWRALRAIRAKTGTLASVSALSGYVLGPPGRGPVAFSIIVNGVSGKTGEVRKDIDAVADAIAHELHGSPRSANVDPR